MTTGPDKDLARLVASIKAAHREYAEGCDKLKNLSDLEPEATAEAFLERDLEEINGLRPRREVRLWEE